ncbi:MAG TPA: hypothetical protein VFL54_03745 [Gammaproteobacteria bacterium]|jgi:hypothetical protein|nr:hypothetical protein [Gammaproteobacteria bacterium]
MRNIKLGQVGVAAFFLGVVVTALMIWMGVSGTPWPRWLIDLTTVL